MGKKNGKHHHHDDEDADSQVDTTVVDGLGVPHDLPQPKRKKLDKDFYESELEKLQRELVKMQEWVTHAGLKVCVLFEGRDAAGKGGVIKRIVERTNPRVVRVAALQKPTEKERTQWYLQRYVEQLRRGGEIVVFDRSWYNRAIVEPVFGFATEEQAQSFLDRVPEFEDMLARDGIRIVKFFLTIGREMQMKRLHARHHDPLKRWKLSQLDYQALDKWDDFSRAIERTLARSDSAAAPWTVVRGNDKRRTRLEVMRYLLETMPYTGKNPKKVGEIDRKIVLSAAAFLGDGGEEE